MANEATSLATSSLDLIADPGFQNELAQVRAHAMMETLGVDSSNINWTYYKRGLERNGTAGIFGIETAVRLDPTVLDGSDSIPTAALRIAQLWEALATTSRDNRTALLTAAASYELAGFQANSATLAERLRQSDPSWVMEPMVIDFLSRKLLSVVAQQDQRELVLPDMTNLDSFATEAANRLLGRALASASRYLLGGQLDYLERATALLDRARDFYSRVGRLAEANLCSTAASLLPVIERRTTWSLIADSSGSARWGRYLKLLGRGSASRAVDGRSLSEFWPSQIQALQAGLVSTRDNLVLRLPTSAGKTRIAEIAIAHQLSEEPTSRCLYVAPYRALVAEIEANFSNLFVDLGVSVTSFFGAYDDDWFEQQVAQDSDLIIATPERLDLIERTIPELFENVRLVVLDEGQTIGDSSRGARYELLMSRLRARLPDARFLIMSAVVPDETLRDFASWLQTSPTGLVVSNWRPSIQRVSRFEWQGNFGVIRYEPSDGPDFPEAFVHGLVESRKFRYNNLDTGRMNTRQFPETNNRSQTAAELALHFSRVGPVLIFCPRTNLVDSTANALFRRLELATLAHEATPTNFAETSTPSSQVAAEWLGNDHKLVQLLRRGIGVHYGRLPDAVRSAVETDFRERRLSVLIATNTLAQGVNLPVRTVIIHSVYRREDERMVPIPAREYWNIAGRAGRAGFETEGTIVHIVFNRNDLSDFRRYQTRRYDVEPVDSVLFNILLGLTRRRVTPEQISGLLNPEILALMTEESPEQFDAVLSNVLSKSLMAAQASRRRVSIEPLVTVMKREANNVRQQVPDWELLQTCRGTGLSSSSCLAMLEFLNDPALPDFLRSAGGAIPRTVIELLIQAMSAVPEFTPSTEPPVNYVDATLSWLGGSTVSEIEDELLGTTSEAAQFGRFAGEFFLHTLPWAASVLIVLAKYVHSLSTSELAPVARSFPSMLRFGVPTPEAAWCMSLGITSRRSAIQMAVDYRATGRNANYPAFRNWFASLEIPDLRSRYALAGEVLEHAIRAIRRVGVASFPNLDGDVRSLLPIETEIVGTQFEGRWVHAIETADGTPVALRREIDNSFDRNAILVLRGENELGYLPRGVAQQLAPEIDTGLQLKATVILSRPHDRLITIEIVEGV